MIHVTNLPDGSRHILVPGDKSPKNCVQLTIDQFDHHHILVSHGVSYNAWAIKGDSKIYRVNTVTGKSKTANDFSPTYTNLIRITRSTDWIYAINTTGDITGTITLLKIDPSTNAVADAVTVYSGAGYITTCGLDSNQANGRVYCFVPLVPGHGINVYVYDLSLALVSSFNVAETTPSGFYGVNSTYFVYGIYPPPGFGNTTMRTRTLAGALVSSFTVAWSGSPSNMVPNESYLYMGNRGSEIKKTTFPGVIAWSTTYAHTIFCFDVSGGQNVIVTNVGAYYLDGSVAYASDLSAWTGLICAERYCVAE